MAKPKHKVRIDWSPDFAYAIGLLATDGNLSPNGRQFDFTSSDIEQLENFKRCLGITNKIGYKKSGDGKRISGRIQFGDVRFYAFLSDIGLMPNKSKRLREIKIPNALFFDFLRGCFDGDGSFHSYWDKRWKSSFMFYVSFVSASKTHIDWLQRKIFSFLKISGHVTKSINSSAYQLKYAKADSLKLLPRIYYQRGIMRLSRKYLKIKRCLATLGLSL